jgi:hypothetical protein
MPDLESSHSPDPGLLRPLPGRRPGYVGCARTEDDEDFRAACDGTVMAWPGIFRTRTRDTRNEGEFDDSGGMPIERDNYLEEFASGDRITGAFASIIRLEDEVEEDDRLQSRDGTILKARMCPQWEIRIRLRESLDEPQDKVWETGEDRQTKQTNPTEKCQEWSEITCCSLIMGRAW